MDQHASILLAFPDGKYSSNEEYHRAARQHVQKVEKLVKEHAADLGSHAAQLLEVSVRLAFTSLFSDDALTLGSTSTRQSILYHTLPCLGSSFSARGHHKRTSYFSHGSQDSL
jgi:hypothetical protein